MIPLIHVRWQACSNSLYWISIMETAMQTVHHQQHISTMSSFSNPMLLIIITLTEQSDTTHIFHQCHHWSSQGMFYHIFRTQWNCSHVTPVPPVPPLNKSGHVITLTDPMKLSTCYTSTTIENAMLCNHTYRSNGNVKLLDNERCCLGMLSAYIAAFILLILYLGQLLQLMLLKSLG